METLKWFGIVLVNTIAVLCGLLWDMLFPRPRVDEFGMDKNAKCGKCGKRLEIVRPGKYQCPECSYSQLHS